MPASDNPPKKKPFHICKKSTYLPITTPKINTSPWLPIKKKEKFELEKKPSMQLWASKIDFASDLEVYLEKKNKIIMMEEFDVC